MVKMDDPSNASTMELLNVTPNRPVPAHLLDDARRVPARPSIREGKRVKVDLLKADRG
jgi:hypothetical protein